MQKNILYSSVLWLCLSACTSKFVKLQQSSSIEEKYKAAIGYFEKKDYFHAGLLFDEILPLLKGNTEAETAQYYNAKCQFETKQYATAAYRFKTFHDIYERSPYAEEAYFMYAYSLYKDTPTYNLDQGNTMTAIDAMQNFINSYPSNTKVEEATRLSKELRLRLEKKAYEKAKLYYKISPTDLREFKAAVIAIQNFQKEFPDSDYNEELAYIKIICQYELAKNSTENKQQERFIDTAKYYEELVDNFPKSKYIKQSEKLYDASKKELDRISKEKTKKEKDKKA